jgi:hypothetical protein
MRHLRVAADRYRQPSQASARLLTSSLSAWHFLARIWTGFLSDRLLFRAVTRISTGLYFAEWQPLWLIFVRWTDAQFDQIICRTLTRILTRLSFALWPFRWTQLADNFGSVTFWLFDNWEGKVRIIRLPITAPTQKWRCSGYTQAYAATRFMLKRK